jgi:hypothetical protein
MMLAKPMSVPRKTSSHFGSMPSLDSRKDRQLAKWSLHTAASSSMLRRQSWSSSLYSNTST